MIDPFENVPERLYLEREEREFQARKLRAFDRAFAAVTAPPPRRVPAPQPSGTAMVLVGSTCWACHKPVPKGATGCPHCARSFCD